MSLDQGDRMKRIPLVERGVAASRLVMGCMSLGGGWNRNPISADDVFAAERAVEAALAIGITMFDHADIYTLGKAEETFGRVLAGRPGLREQIVVQSKCGIRLAEGSLPGRFDFSREHILASIDGSLRRLGTPYLDVLLLHRPDALMEPDEIAEAFAAAKAAGKVRHFGVSNMDVGQMRFLQRALPDALVVNQLELSLARLDWLDQGVHVNQKVGAGVHFGEGLLEHCQTEAIQIQAWGPLAQGRFSGRPVDDQPESVRATAALVERMAGEKAVSREAIVLGWLMRHPAGIQPVLGTIDPGRLAACAGAEALAAAMTRDEWYTLFVSARGERLP